MEALLAIAALCGIAGGVSTTAIESKQLECQQQLIKCYFDGSKGLTYFDPSGKAPESGKLLYQCALNRVIRQPVSPEPSPSVR